MERLLSGAWRHLVANDLRGRHRLSEPLIVRVRGGFRGITGRGVCTKKAMPASNHIAVDRGVDGQQRRQPQRSADSARSKRIRAG